MYIRVYKQVYAQVWRQVNNKVSDQVVRAGNPVNVQVSNQMYVSNNRKRY